MIWSHTVGDVKFDNKLLAIKHSQETGQQIGFDTPKAYASFDFSTEPSESLPTLLRRQAERIRDTHKKVRIYFSGGSDSALMLNTFIQNNIPFDEVICLKSGIADADYEIDKHAIPLLRQLGVEGSKVKISVPSMETYRKYYKEGVTEQKINAGLLTYNTHIRLIAQAELFNPENYDPDTANLRGFDKPKIMHVDGDCYTYFIDVDIETFPHTKMFFSDDPELQCKQAHLFNKATREMKESKIWDDQTTWNASIGRDAGSIRKSVYFNEGDNFFQHKDKKLYFANLKEKKAVSWMLHNQSDIVTDWAKLLSDLKDYTNGQWWNHGRPEFGTVGIFSKFYGITTDQVKTVDELFPQGFKSQ